jgi:hypothetical protein
MVSEAWIGCAQNDRQVIKGISDILKQIDAVVFHQLHIHDHKIRVLFFDELHKPGTIATGDHIVSFVREFTRIEHLDPLIIVNNKDFVHSAYPLLLPRPKSLGLSVNTPSPGLAFETLNN